MTVAPRSSERGLRHTVHASELLPPGLPYVSAGLLSVLLLLYLLVGRNGQKDTPTARRIDRPGKGHLLFSCAEWRCLPPVACKVLQLSAVSAVPGFCGHVNAGHVWGTSFLCCSFVDFVCEKVAAKETSKRAVEMENAWLLVKRFLERTPFRRVRPFSAGD